MVTENEKLQVLESSDGCVFLLLEYDIFLLTWKRIEFTPQIKVNKYIKIVETKYHSINCSHMP